jgi:hypothetical protein
LLTSLVLAASLMGQSFRESKHDEFHQVIDRRSPALKAKLAKQKVERHAAAEQSRKDFDAAMAILRQPPTIGCPCHMRGGFR